MHDDSDPFVFPELPDEAVVALNRFLEDFYTAFQNHYFAQIHRWYQLQPPDDNQLPLPFNSPF
jgi:hypothetical protein